MRIQRLVTSAVTLLAVGFSAGLAGTVPAQADPAPPVTGAVSIMTDTYVVGGTWQTTVTSTPTSARRAFQWLRDGQPITGATLRTYVNAAEDVGHSISVAVTLSATGYEPTTVTSTAYGPIEGAAPPPVVVTQPGSGGSGGAEDDELDTFDAYRPLITGRARSGMTVSVVTDPDDYNDTTTLAFQWLVNGAPARKGTGSVFKIKKKYLGKMISVQVTASETGYETETVTSRPKKIRH